MTVGTTALTIGGIAALAAAAGVWRTSTTRRERRGRADASLRVIADALTRTGDEFLPAAARAVCESLGASLAVAGELSEDGTLQTLAVARSGEAADPFTYDLSAGPWRELLSDRVFLAADRIRDRYPGDPQLAAAGARGAIGVALVDANRKTIGMLLAATRDPIGDAGHAQSVMTMLAGRAGAEIERVRTARELRRQEEHLLQVQRVEAIGRLAGGVAHDFNNLLMIMIGYAEILRERTGPSSELTELLTAANRATTLTRQLLAFGRRQVLQSQRIDINRIVTAVESMLRPVLGAHVEIVTSLDATLPAVEADPGQLEQVLVNLALNARDAMPGGGTLRLETRTDRFEQPHLQMPAGTYVTLAVSDTGTGMTADVQAHIFEPFFTTKGSRGTGLGLSSVYGIVKQSGGFIWCESDPGRGTRFRIHLQPARGAVMPAGAAEGETPMLGGTERVLVVDDEPGVRRLVAHLLSTRGYDVREAVDGPSAIAMLAGPNVAFDLVLTDVEMPGMSGVQLADTIGTRWPATKVLLISGYAHAVSARGDLHEPSRDILAKPFTPARIVRAVRDALDGRTSAPQRRTA